MPIVALPPTTVRAIGSTSIISDPYSLTKELLDNALDAGASSVSVEISQDTVDIIQVKDNGHGISPSDYPLVCKRTFTSKIHTVEDLRTVGGKSLGFRGEALASAAEISGTFMVLTRVESEPVGSSLKYGRDGELISTERVAHPVGTTVRVSNLFRQIPVRRQTAIKNSKKALARIRKMIQSYAMAKPSVRLSLKVLKAKNESGNWMYAPGKNTTLLEAALKVAGTDVASTCTVKEWPASSTNEDESLQGIDANIRLIALLPKLGSDFTQFNNLGQYISIDGRPVSASRGVAQDVVKLYKSYLRFASSQDGLAPTITDPFLCIHIMCPDGAYDVNIEPSKDDVLFEDQNAVLTMIEDLLKDTYVGQLGERTSEQEPVEWDRDEFLRRGSEALPSARQPDATPDIYQVQAESTSPQNDFVSARSLEYSKQPSHSPSISKHGHGTQSGRSPFVRFNNTKASNIFPSSQRQKGFSRTAEPVHNLGSCLPSPVSSFGSSPANVPSQSISVNRIIPSSTSPTQLSPTTPARGLRQEQRDRDKERYGNGSLDTWFLKLSQAAQDSMVTQNDQTQNEEPSLSQLTQDRFGHEQISPSDPSNSTNSFSSQIMSEPSNSPLQLNPSQASSLVPARAAQTASRGKGKGLPVLEQWAARLYNASNPDENPELQKALEFETRKRATILERRMQLQSSAASVPTSSPHKNRYLAARAALNSHPESAPQVSGLGDAEGSNWPLTPASKPALSPHDPRAYLVRLLNAEASGIPHPKRIASSKLPFEKIPDECDLHDVGVAWPIERSEFQDSFNEISKTDLYTRTDEQVEGFSSTDMNAIIDMWQRRLSNLIKTQYKSTEGDSIPNLQFDFSGIPRTTQAAAT